METFSKNTVGHGTILSIQPHWGEVGLTFFFPLAHDGTKFFRSLQVPSDSVFSLQTREITSFILRFFNGSNPGFIPKKVGEPSIKRKTCLVVQVEGIDLRGNDPFIDFVSHETLSEENDYCPFITYE